VGSHIVISTEGPQGPSGEISPCVTPGRDEFWRRLQEEDQREDAREHGLHVEM